MTTHTSSVSVPGWSGAGYIVIDPKSGDGAYVISGGGSNGGFILILSGVLMLASVILLGIVGFAISAIFQLATIGLSYCL